MFVKATLRGGRTVVGEFTKLSKLRRLAADIMAGRKAFPLWRVVSDRHPVSGEQGVITRQRTFIASQEIVELEQVKPIRGREENHSYEADNFEPVEHIGYTRGRGQWTCPDPKPEGAELAVEGVAYPIHRDDAQGMRRYVILKASEGHVPEERFYLDQPAPSFSDEEEDSFDDGGEWDEEDDDDI